MEGAIAEAYSEAYLNALKAKADITVNKQLLDANRQQ
jgi:hypothetical protein